MIYLDTHVAAFLYAGELHRLPPKSKILVEQEPLFISGTVLIELQYLFEIKRVALDAEHTYHILHTKCGVNLCKASLAEVSRIALSLSWTRDAFDRMIVANAALTQKPLVTKDQMILQHYSRAVWE